MLSTGDILAGKYAIERMLGKGGMGYVMAARHTQLDQLVAIKFLIPELCENHEAVARFLREARSSARIQSEHVARVLDVGTMDDGEPYMVMEFLEGHDLARELELRPKQSITDAIDYILQACEALAEAHALGIVHRDLKPANLFRTWKAEGTPFIKVLDFGISKALDPTGQGAAVTLTQTQGLVGSPHYMSPEQVRKPKSVDTRSDIWSLGVILYEFLGGAPPFVADTPMSVLAAVVSDDPPALTQIRPDVPRELQQVVLTTLQKDVERRYQTVLALAEALQPFAALASRPGVQRIAAIDRSTRARASQSGSAPPPDTVQRKDTDPTLDSGGGGTLPSPGVFNSIEPISSSARHPKTSYRRWLAVVGAAVLLVGMAIVALRQASRRSHEVGPVIAAPQEPSPVVEAQATARAKAMVAPSSPSVLELPTRPALPTASTPAVGFPAAEPPASSPVPAIRRAHGAKHLAAARDAGIAPVPLPRIDPLDGRN